MLSTARLMLFFQSLSFLAVSSRILALGTIPMETELACFLKEHFSYLPCSGFTRDSLCELFLSQDNKCLADIKVEFTFYPPPTFPFFPCKMFWI